MTPSGTIDYETMAQDAMRGVIRKILKATEQSGLPGEHHFYISFDTTAPGAILSKRLRERYPEEMTIVLQHRFWDLAVGEDQFEVKLTFDSIPERLVVPFKAIKVFFDPSVRYALQFESQDLSDETDQGKSSPKGMVEPKPSPAQSDRPVKRSLTPVASKPVTKLKRTPGSAPPASIGNGNPSRIAEGDDATAASGNQNAAVTDRHENAKPDASDDARDAVTSAADAATSDNSKGGKDKSKKEAAAQDDAEKSDSGATVVSLDSFRKK